MEKKKMMMTIMMMMVMMAMMGKTINNTSNWCDFLASN